MSRSPRFQQPFQFEPWEQTPSSVSPKKWSLGVQSNKINTKLMPSQQSATIFHKHRMSAKTQPKFYQKTQKRMQNSIFKQKIDSIKPIGLNQYDENQFIMQPRTKRIEQKTNTYTQQKEDQGLSFHTPCIGLINPMYINVKCNPKRLANSCQLTKARLQQNQQNSRSPTRINKKMMYQTSTNLQIESNLSTILPVKKQNPSQTLYFRIVSEMNEYFNSMKLMSFKNNKTQQIAKRSIRSHSEKIDMRQNKRQAKHFSSKFNPCNDNADDSLNVIGLRPITSDYQKINRNYSSNAQFPKSMSKQLKEKQSLNASKVYESQHITPQANDKQDKNQSTFQVSKLIPRYDLIECQNLSSMIISNEIISSPINRIKQKKALSNIRPFTQQIKRSLSPGTKKIKYKGFCFGEINLPKNSPQEIYRLKVLYYKDLLWKNSFNLGIKYLPAKNGNEELTNLKYFVGKGNNSKLIKVIMAKRWWWSLDTKQENSNFVWTQLKIYSIYQKQSNNPIQQQNPQTQHEQKKKISLLSQEKIENKIPQQKSFVENSALILNQQKRNFWQSYISNQQNQDRQKKITEQNMVIMRKRLQKKINQVKCLESPSKITNHLEFSRAIGNKKALYKVMMLYFEKVKKCPTDQIFVPLTYHITAGLQDEEYLKFLTEYYRRNKALNKTCWIVKPGQLTNRGRGIKYCKDLNEIKPIVKKKQTHPNGSLKTFLIQEYLDRPMLYKGRKFDIRHYIMISSINGKLRGYFYQGGYIRTTSYKYKLDDNSPAIHLTNDAVQKYCKDYGKYEKGNKLSYEQFDEYVQQKYPSEDENKKISFFNTIHPQIRKISTEVIHAAYYFVDPKRKINNFEIFGLDIMVDESLKCYLIEVNTNPCLQLSSPVLKNVIPDMLDNAFALTLDCCYPPPQKQSLCQYNKKYKYPISPQNKFELVFDEDIDGKQVKRIFQKQGIEPNEMSGIGDDDDNFESCEEDNEDY